MKRIVDQPPLRSYSNLDYTNGLNDALGRRESIINLFLGIGIHGNRVAPAQTTIARLILPQGKNYDGDPFAEPYAGDYSLDVVDIDRPSPRHARQLPAFVYRVRLELTATAGESHSSAKPQDFHVNDEGMLFAGGGLRLWLHPDVELGYVPVQWESAEPTAPNAAVLVPTPTSPLEVAQYVH